MARMKMETVKIRSSCSPRNFLPAEVNHVIATFFCLLELLFPLVKANRGLHISLSSFDLDLFPVDWIRRLNMLSLSTEAQTRFGLGIAGYRLISAIAKVEPDLELSEEVARAYKVVLELNNRGYLWEIHPLFRNSKRKKYFWILHLSLRYKTIDEVSKIFFIINLRLPCPQASQSGKTRMRGDFSSSEKQQDSLLQGSG